MIPRLLICTGTIIVFSILTTATIAALGLWK